ncbi:MAG: prolipoprotein diacylglyceryl transferase [Oscillospiraceae bacterium]|nr:prolipoprotein diacylglyceryl transferase [Oscillospiraceae bacterium]
MGSPITLFGIEMDPNRAAFTIFGREIHWYGIIIAVAFLVAAFYVTRRAPKVGISGDDVIDALLFAVPVAIIFSRVYYVLFNLQEFSDPSKSIWAIWDGGIAIYGAIIGGVLTVFVFSRLKKKRKVDFPAFMDVLVPGLFIGQCIGRWGNFINREVYGTVTDLPWKMTLEGKSVHPTFLYESLWCLVGFLALHFLFKKRRFNGQITLMYAAWYGLGRAFFEGLREKEYSLYIGSTDIRVSQLLSVLIFVAAMALLAYHLLYKKHDPAVELLAPLPPRVKGKGSGTPVATEDGEPKDADGGEAKVAEAKAADVASEDGDDGEAEAADDGEAEAVFDGEAKAKAKADKPDKAKAADKAEESSGEDKTE